MKTRISILTIFMAGILAGTVAGVPVFGQTPSRTAYFLDGYDFKHQLNPAIPSARSYFSLPALGNTNFSAQSAFGLDTFFYPTGDGNMTTFMSNSVSGEEFLGKLKKKNPSYFDMSTSLLSVGVWDSKWTHRGFSTLDIGFVNNLGVNVPYDFFSFMKNVGDSEHYDISRLGGRATSYFQIALGRSQRINAHLTVGAKLKFLIGIADMQMDISKMSVDMNEDKWSVYSQGSFRASSGSFLLIPTYAEAGAAGGRPDQIYYDGVDLRKGKTSTYIGGYGAALDLGVTYEGPADGLTLSASVLDFGFIRWKSSTYGITSDSSWSFDGFENISLNEDSDNYLRTQISNMADDIKDLMRFYKDGKSGPSTQMLGATVLVGGEYKMPFYKNLSAGALVTTHIQGPYTWAEGRVSANLALGNCFGFAVSYGLSTFGSSLGSALTLHCKGLNFYLAMDSIPFRYTVPLEDVGLGLPLGKLRANFNFGLAFNVSSRKDKN